MKTHQWILRVLMQARIDPAARQKGTVRTNPASRATRGALMMALVLMGLVTSAYLARSGHAISNPWMY
jgi:hypothetical protein